MITYSSLGRSGRFCNQIMQIAGTIATGLKYGHEYGFPEWKNWDAQERFGTQEDIYVQKYFVNPLPPAPEGIQYIPVNYYWGYREIMLPIHSNYDFAGIHFQSDKYWKGYESTIRHYMTMKDEPEWLDATIFHWRAGDYSDWNQGYHPRCSIDYYRRAAELVTGDILITSDNIREFSKMMDEIGLKYSIINEGYLETFKIMKRCKNFVIANSSYSLAAAMLSDQPGKMVITPGDEHWFGTSFGPDYKEMSHDIFPEGSIQINA